MAGSTTAGRRLGRYHLGDPLGGGPCGAVYRAKVYGVAGFERQFAVKRFHPELVALPVVSQRLSAAARAYGSLEHPRIARLHEYGVASGEVFTATEMVAGLDIMRLGAATHGAGAPLPPGAALALVTQAARAIGYAHGRGVNHLGLCPTNVVVTPDGDVKITDFGILAQTLTIRPSEDSRLGMRIPYLAPEQLVGEATSAATDVFALGALVHELLTGERAFVGVTSLDVEHAILSGHVRDAGLPKSLARVLVRCFARSPYERFPDARALADAIDAALRVSPVVGGRRELGGIVKDAVARLEAMNEGQLSGAMMLAMPMPPSPATTMKMSGAVPPPTSKTSRTTDADAITAIRDPLAAPGAATSAPSSRTSSPPRRAGPPTRPPPISPPSVLPPRVVQKTMPPPVLAARLAAALAHEDSDERTIQRDPMATRALGAGAPHLTPAPGPELTSPARMANASPPPFRAATDEVTAPDPALGARLRLDSAWETGERKAMPVGAEPLAIDKASPVAPVIDDDSEGVLVPAPLRGEAPAPPVAEMLPPRVEAPRTQRSSLWVALFLVLCAGVGVVGVLVWYTWLRDRGDDVQAGAAPKDPGKQPDPRPAGAVDGGTGAGTGVGKVAAAPPDAGIVAAPVDAAAAAVASAIDAGAVQVDREPPPDPGAGDSLLITSTPAKAVVFVDGAEQGETPVKLAASADRHSIAVVLPGYALYTADIDGSGNHAVTLTEVTPSNGPAGIKVKCKEKDRYYVFVDGAPTGQLCPTERIGVELGDHTVDVYDLVTESRRQYPLEVKETRNSARVKVE